MKNAGPLLLMLLPIAFVYLLVLRPARNRQRHASALQNSLRAGQEVMTTAGLLGTVSEVTDDVVILEVAPGVHNRYAKGAVARVVTPAEPGSSPESTSTPDSEVATERSRS